MKETEVKIESSSNESNSFSSSSESYVPQTPKRFKADEDDTVMSYTEKMYCNKALTLLEKYDSGSSKLKSKKTITDAIAEKDQILILTPQSEL